MVDLFERLGLETYKSWLRRLVTRSQNRGSTIPATATAIGASKSHLDSAINPHEGKFLSLHRCLLLLGLVGATDGETLQAARAWAINRLQRSQDCRAHASWIDALSSVRRRDDPPVADLVNGVLDGMIRREMSRHGHESNLTESRL